MNGSLLVTCKHISTWVPLSIRGVIIGIVCGSFWFSSCARANIKIETDVIICPAQPDVSSIPDFTAEDCKPLLFHQINPTGAAIWLKSDLVVPKALYESPIPLGIFIAGKASSEVYLNDELIGRNGQPGYSKANEVVGKMDAVLFAPRSILKPGYNKLVVKMSGHHGFLQLQHPFHWLGLGKYSDPTTSILRHYWKSLLPLGILVFGAAYFAIAAFRQREPLTAYLLPLMALFSAGQLCVEVSRGLVAYPYPFHDIRLVLILLFSLGFGLGMLGHLLRVLDFRFNKGIFLVGTAATIGMITITRGFDLKSALASGIPMLIGLGLTGYKAWQGSRQALQFAAGLVVFLLTVFLAPQNFLDIYFFYIVAALVVFLFIQQLIAFSNVRKERADEKNRADKLQLIIEQNQLESEKPTLAVTSAGKTDLVAIADLICCKGAGDYVELAMIGGRTILHSESMTELETQLPATFLRVHRSYIVNTSLIESVVRKKSGVGELQLPHGITVPVSRRIMPSVREQLTPERLANTA